MFFAPALRSRAFVAPRSFDRNFERFVNEAFVGARRSLDVQEDDKGWTLSLDVPGIAREQLNIGIEGAVVRIETLADAARQYKAAYELPQEIDAAASEARLENGVLVLKLAKLAPVNKTVSLTIQ
ncbi:Hsp20/alpha crystallin family protein [Xenophilus arseniciresistens]|uniref:Hsp20/alpha crystallin family protein n=1 Tax=Xenophilus arseniciresistens TaxID=1283306 RepID=A0AAE3N9P7_9BURK|nr:Hsp20/alpha crystallin family protein [Xenophilus arseniciresistens]MDA7417208.1 Hsp20/alpha crystallin family protein [Xenophilus arseniciresistens]